MEIIILSALLLLVAETTYVAYTVSNTSTVTKRKIFVDTSVLIDGRIIPLAETGVIGDTLLIPRSVVGELQLLADGADTEKRARARAGLDVVAELQALESVTVKLFNDSESAPEGVDNRLLRLAKKHKAALMTIDYNLAKVATVENIVVININDIAKNLRMAHLPGEKIRLMLTAKGNDSQQAVGHLDDGTMVVVEQARSSIGAAVDVEVIRSLQTSAGRMMFARMVEKKKPEKKKQEPVAQPQPKQAKTIEKVKKAADRPARKQPQRSRRRPKREDKESELIALVNNQEDR